MECSDGMECSIMASQWTALRAYTTCFLSSYRLLGVNAFKSGVYCEKISNKLTSTVSEYLSERVQQFGWIIVLIKDQQFSSARSNSSLSELWGQKLCKSLICALLNLNSFLINDQRCLLTRAQHLLHPGGMAAVAWLLRDHLKRSITPLGCNGLWSANFCSANSRSFSPDPKSAWRSLNPQWSDSTISVSNLLLFIHLSSFLLNQCNIICLQYRRLHF